MNKCSKKAETSRYRNVIASLLPAGEANMFMSRLCVGLRVRIICLHRQMSIQGTFGYVLLVLTDCFGQGNWPRNDALSLNL